MVGVVEGVEADQVNKYKKGAKAILVAQSCRNEVSPLNPKVAQMQQLHSSECSQRDSKIKLDSYNINIELQLQRA